jgi:hypothetical protein
MNVPFVRHTFVVIAVAAVGAALFRVATAPDRIAERRNTARSVCLGNGGEWVNDGRNEICRRADSAAKP